MTALVEALDLDAVGVVGFSGGGSHALATAADPDLADRLTGVGLLGSVGPPGAPQDDVARGNRVLSRLVRRAPFLARGLMRSQAWFAGRGGPERVTALYTDRGVGSAPDDLEPSLADLVRRDFLEAFRQGARAVVRDSRLFARPWGFDLGAIDVPVTCWYGTDDANCPPAYGEFLADRLPDAQLTTLDGADHFDILLRATPDAIRSVAP